MSNSASVTEFLAARVREVEEASATKQVEAEQAAQLVLSLPLSSRFDSLHDGVYLMSNVLARGGLFAAVKDRDRLLLREKVVKSLSNYQVTYTGDQLNQSDLDVLMAVICEARDQPMGDRVGFTAYRVLKRMGWTHNTDSYARLRECLKRLQRAQVTIEFKRDNKRSVRYTGSFIKDFAEADNRPLGRENDSKLDRSHWNVNLDERFSTLFANDEVTLGVWHIRTQLDGRMPLAQFLHSFYSTHAEPIPMTVGKLRELSESAEKNASNFIYRLENALRKLVKIGFLKSYSIDRTTQTIDSLSMLVKVSRVPPSVLAQRARERLRGREGKGRAMSEVGAALLLAQTSNN